MHIRGNNQEKIGPLGVHLANLHIYKKRGISFDTPLVQNQHSWTFLCESKDISILHQTVSRVNDCLVITKPT
jgi:hypothetical protein